MIEDQLRRALHDPGLGLPVPPDPVAWVHQRVRRQRRLAVAGSSLATAVVVALAVLLVPLGPGTSPAPVAAGTLDWEPRGELGRDPQVREDLQEAWDEAGEVFRTRGAAEPPAARTGPVSVLWAGTPDPGTSTRAARRAALVQAPTVEGAAVASALDRGEGWVLERWDDLPDSGVAALALHVGPAEPVPFGPNGRDEVHVLTAPGVEGEVDVRTSRYVVGAPVDDALAGPFFVEAPSPALEPGTEERFLVRLGERLLAPPCGGDLGPLLEPVSTATVEAVEGWPALGGLPTQAELADDATSLLTRRCASSATAAPLWSGRLVSGEEVRVVELARPDASPVVALVMPLVGPAVLAAGTAQAPVVLLTQARGVDTVELVAVGSLEVARIELEGAEPARAQGRVLVHRSEHGSIGRSTLVAYDAQGRELLRRRVTDPAWQPTG